MRIKCVVMCRRGRGRGREREREGEGEGEGEGGWEIQTGRGSADPTLLGALCKTVGWGGVGMRMDETHLSVFHSVSNKVCRHPGSCRRF